jgi:hypothetical protein
MTISKNPSDLQVSGDPSLKAEERRALVLLGLLAVIVGLYDKLSADSSLTFLRILLFPISRFLSALYSPI